MTYEERMMKQRIDSLANSISDDKLKIWMNLLKYKKSDITTDQDIFFQVNADRMPMEDFVNKRASKFLSTKVAMRTMKEGLYDPNFAVSKEKKLRWKGDIPEEIWFTHPWFSPMLDKRERDQNINKFFNLFPEFRAGSKTL